jgi:hypothetical protein
MAISQKENKEETNMKTKFEKIDGRWVVATGKLVVVDCIYTGDDYDMFLGNQYIDVCTGETFAKEKDEVMSDVVGEPIWHLVKYYCEEMPEYQKVRGNSKKIARAARINAICGTHWTKHFGTKRIGKNRKMARIMYPNAVQLADFENDLPF